MAEYYGIHYDSVIEHHGIKGQKWGVRRYQNPDGTLTPEGKKRLLGYKYYAKNMGHDTTVKKGTKATRVLRIPSRSFDYLSPRFGGTYEDANQALKEKIKSDDALEQKYLSVKKKTKDDGVDGTKFYAEWLSDSLTSPNRIVVSSYEFKRDAKVASGKKVLNELIKQVGNERIKDIIDSDMSSVRKLTSQYTTDKTLFDSVNTKLKAQGYDAVQDINDTTTDMPIITLTRDIIGAPVKIEKGRDFIEKNFDFAYHEKDPDFDYGDEDYANMKLPKLK